MPATGGGGPALQDCVDQTKLAALPDHGEGGGHLPHDFGAALLERPEKSVKQELRQQHGLTVQREERREIWKAVFLKREAADADANAGLYWETVRTCFGGEELPSSEIPLPPIVENKHANAFCLNAAGRKSVARILTCVAYNSPDIQYCPYSYPVAAVLRHYLSEEDTYGLLVNMASSKRPNFFPTSKVQHEIEWRAVMELHKEYNKKVLGHLQPESNEQDHERLFREWFWALFGSLPLPHVVRIMDCYLIEGQKVLYRTSLALTRFFCKALKSKPTLSESVKKMGLVGAFHKFAAEVPVSPGSLLDKSFRFRDFGRAKIQKYFLRIETDIKARGLSAAHGDRSRSDDNLPSAKALDDIRKVSDTLSYKQLITIWHWLPERMTTIDPTLVYSSEEHGISLSTFYTKSELYEPTILVVKTKTGEIFGAYCSTSWGERNAKDERGQRQAYFGTGETFLFKLSGRDGDDDGSVKYPWVNLKGTANGEEKLSKAEEHAKELFMCGQFDMVAIGGGGGNGIYIDSSMTFGKTEHCKTFDNPPLCEKGDFQIAIIEVYGLNKLDW